MKVKIKRLSDKAVIPTYAKYGDAGMDLVTTSRSYDENGNVVYGTDLTFEIPKGYVGLLFPRSSNSKQDLILSNSVGVLDSGYRGEVMFKFKRIYDVEKNHKYLCKILESYCDVELQGGSINVEDLLPNYYEIGDRIGQLIIIPYPQIEFEEVEELSETERGSGGYGSTGN